MKQTQRAIKLLNLDLDLVVPNLNLAAMVRVLVMEKVTYKPLLNLDIQGLYKPIFKLKVVS